MADDIVDRLRAGALSGDLPLGAAFNWDQVADEIERLRAPTSSCRFGHEPTRLQALIDAWATKTDDGSWDDFIEARDALLAAATKKEDDRG